MRKDQIIESFGGLTAEETREVAQEALTNLPGNDQIIAVLKGVDRDELEELQGRLEQLIDEEMPLEEVLSILGE